jgi:hypothetical protein
MRSPEKRDKQPGEQSLMTTEEREWSEKKPISLFLPT